MLARIIVQSSDDESILGVFGIFSATPQVNVDGSWSRKPLCTAFRVVLDLLGYS